MLNAITGMPPAIYWFAVIIYLEIMLRLATVKKFKKPGLHNTLIWSAFYASVLAPMASPFGGLVKEGLAAIFIILLFFIFASQLVYFKIFKMLYTFFSMGNAGQVLDFVKDIIAYIAMSAKWLLILSLPLVLHFSIFAGLTPEAAIPQAALSENASASNSIGGLTPFMTPFITQLVTPLILIAVLLLIAKIIIRVSKNKLGGAYEAYFRSMDPTVTLSHFGLLTTMRLDFQRSLLGMKSKIYETNAGHTRISEELTQQPTPQTTPDPTPQWPNAQYNALPIDFSAYAAKSKDPRLKALHNWFASETPSPKNPYTGRYRGFNLIFITAESLSPYSIHPELTPTLYKMVHEGTNFTEFYNPIWGVSTSDGEYVACTGLLPKSGIWSFIDSASKNMAMTLGNQLRPLGYTTTAYHNHRYSYYKRHLSHPNMGYTYFGLGNGLDVTPTWPESDLEMIQHSVPEYINREPFHTYYMTVSGHMRYSFRGNAMAAKNRAAVDHLPLSNEAKAYLATQIELDRAMADLLSQLEAAGVAERTLIAMSADHYPYGLSDKALDELAGHPVERTFELYRSPFILYSRGQTPEVITTPCSSLDILPTLSNLLGLDFDSRLLMGRDIFSGAPPFVTFLNKSFITDRGRYDALSKAFLPMVPATPSHPIPTASPNYIQEVTRQIDDIFLASARILELDYYNHLVELKK
ncbi:LTA synthase family protein [Acidaminobacter hydrogenoformans]|uniref:Sulfatase n=1 Tax=Acidaminobacter hydrogenoformans DSM 2784 TaxID=1120920 RepID=A0A1G5RY35_9FIRM|nr:LTA synthase family protein [Acidaminobacter hydrogenoformans]SCZ78239.1 Sulfatase [Acidaminobacter hydrogenoformans DSM 2784]